VIATCLDPGGARETSRIRGNIDVVKLDVTDHAAIDALSHQLAKEPIAVC
jgi:hypothetical protein